MFTGRHGRYFLPLFVVQRWDIAPSAQAHPELRTDRNHQDFLLGFGQRLGKTRFGFGCSNRQLDMIDDAPDGALADHECLFGNVGHMRKRSD